MSSSCIFNIPNAEDLFELYIRPSLPAANTEPCSDAYGNGTQFRTNSVVANPIQFNTTPQAADYPPMQLDLSWLDSVCNTANQSASEPRPTSVDSAQTQASNTTISVNFTNLDNCISRANSTLEHATMKAGFSTINPTLLNPSNHPSLHFTSTPSYVSSSSAPAAANFSFHSAQQRAPELHTSSAHSIQSDPSFSPSTSESTVNGRSSPATAGSKPVRYQPYATKCKQPKKQITVHKCPCCSYSVLSPRMPDLRRHMQTHREFKTKAWICSGRLLNGIWTGGCSKEFSRRDSLKRHFLDPNNQCSGDLIPHIVDPETSLIVAPY